jgi:hypothetical protein
MCHFILDMRQWNAHPNGTTHSPSAINSFHAAAQRAGAAVIEEFGDPLYNESLRESQSSREVSGSVGEPQSTGEGIELADIHPQTQPTDLVVDPA